MNASAVPTSAWARWPLLPAICALVLIVLPSVGCRPEGPETCPVSGTVTFDGQPVPEGSILFVPTEGKGIPDPGKIEGGEFSFRAKPGPKRVEIQASRPSAAVDSSMGMAPRESYIPAQYNARSTLSANVTRDGDNRFTFTLSSDPADQAPAR